MQKFRVTYTAVKRDNKYRNQVVNGQETGTLELVDTRIAFHEEKTVEVEAETEQAAIQEATKHLPKDVELSAAASKLGAAQPSGYARVPTPPAKPEVKPAPIPFKVPTPPATKGTK